VAETVWTKVAKEKDLAEGVPLAAKVGKDDVLLVRLKGKVRACGGKCTHYGAPLAEGLVVGGEVQCPWHNARFDLATGEMTAPPALDGVGCYPVKIEKGEVFVGPKKRSEFPAMAEGKGELPSRKRTETTFAIIGAGAAGNAAAETLRREGFGGRIVLITAEPDRPYDRPNLSKDYLAGEADPDWIPLRSETFYDKLKVELLTGRRVAALDPKARTIAFEDGKALKFDQALVATGGVPRRLDVPGASLTGVFLLRSLADSKAIVAAAEKAGSAVVIGAGFIGAEAASSLRHRGLEVHLVAPEEAPLARVFGERIGQWVRGLHEEGGVRLHLGTTVKEIRGRNRVEAVVLADGTTIETNLVVTGLGITPAVACLDGTGLVTGGAVPVDGWLQTRAEGVFAAGDIALAPNPRTGEAERIEHWVVAERQGQHAARAMLGSRAHYDLVPFFWTRQFGKSLQYFGFARQWDRVAYRGRVEDGDFLAGYYAGGNLRALAASGRPKEAIAAGCAIQTGRKLSADEFEDAGTDLEALTG